MKDKKCEFKIFNVIQWKKEQDYLSRMHAEGWALDRVSFLNLYHFKRCEPQQVVYQLDYNPEGLENKAEYVQMFRDCGWEYLQDYAGYSYFRKSAEQMQGDEEIFCDDESRIDMMKRVFKGRLFPLLIILFLLLLPNMFGPCDGLDDYIIRGLFSVVFVLYAAVFISFAVQYFRYIGGSRRK